MGKYTQTLYEYMQSIDLDPFDEEDQIEAGRTLLKVKYDVPEEAMNTLLQRFVISYINNEVAFGNIDRFRMELMKYAVQRRPWYEKMHGMFDELLPFEFVEEVRTRELTENEQAQLVRELKRDLMGRIHGTDTGKIDYNSVLTSIDNERTSTKNNDSRKEARKLNEHRGVTDQRRGGTTTSSEENFGENTSNRNTANENVSDNRTANNTNTQTKGGRDSLKRNARDANGFGSIDSFAEPGLMVNDSTVTDGEDTTLYNSTVTTDDRVNERGGSNKNASDSGSSSRVNQTKSGQKTNRNEQDVSETKANEQEGRDVSSTGLSSRDTENKSTSTNRNEQSTSKTNDELRNDRTDEDTTQLNEKDTITKEVETKVGNNEWKARLAREFYDLFVSIDDEWVRGARDLFSYIY